MKALILLFQTISRGWTVLLCLPSFTTLDSNAQIWFCLLSVSASLYIIFAPPHSGSVRGSMFDLSLDQATKSPIPEDGAEPEGHQTPASQEHECMYTIYAAMNRIITLCPLLLRHDLLAIYYCTFTPWINMAELLVYQANSDPGIPCYDWPKL